MPFTKQKRTGAHFTPPGLASLVAERLVEHFRGSETGLRILDPACGDGNLLVAIAQALPRGLLARCTLIGVEQDAASFAALRERLAAFRHCRTELTSSDFLDLFEDRPLFGPPCPIEPADVIIANPPYVRTQVLGAARAQELASTFHLSGRVDLYQAFLVAMTRQLKPGGLLGVITSNRFLTTKGGMASRRLLRSQFDVLEIIDLGDTKLFDAAVLPALVFARKRGDPGQSSRQITAPFIRVYEDVAPRAATEAAGSIVDLLRHARPGRYAVNGNTYRLSTGRLSLPEDCAVPWTMQTAEEESWVGRIDAQAACRLREVAQIRVGVKTTADKVFIRRDWARLPPDERPEPQYLCPLLSQEDAARWRPARNDNEARRILYTHEAVGGRRRPIAFPRDSSAWSYLQAHRDLLEKRRYVIEAGRNWWEIWVPQDPQAWRLPKIVFPDISPNARFFLDRSGSVVDGNCDWITTNDPEDEDLLLLILGVINSSVLARYHELCYQNKLYSQRRRYLTQYVQEYPLPARQLDACGQIIELVRRLTREDLAAKNQVPLERRLNALVAKAFAVDDPALVSTAGHSTTTTTWQTGMSAPRARGPSSAGSRDGKGHVHPARENASGDK